MAELILGPLLRHVGRCDATVWVETSEACTVEVLGCTERTWTVAGHHYALVIVEGLGPGSRTEYEVSLDGHRVWPLPDAPAPSTIRTLADDGTLVLTFGSCRFATKSATENIRHLDVDALDAYSRRMMTQSPESWPDALLLLGDQVYADELSDDIAKRVGEVHDVDEPPGAQVRNFEEYTWLYAESWSDPEVRWLLSTVPTSMIFDDHDVTDDWNTSQSWREELEASSWWEERIVGALSSYWVYQHLGNLAPAQLAENELYQRVRKDGGDVEPLLREFASAADEEADGAKGMQWSYRRDLGPARLLVIDSRCGRVLADGRRDMVSEPEFSWIEQQTDGDYDHLLVGTSLPWLLPRALHDLESWDERLAAGSRGPRMATLAEKLRRGADLEHWASFRDSFDKLARLFGQVGRGERTGPAGRSPSTISVLSGDVHHAYVAEARYPEPILSHVYQLTCSPLHNYVPAAMKVTFRISWSRVTERAVRFLLSRVSRVPPVPVEWSKVTGPFFGNQVATLHLDGRAARLVMEQAAPGTNDAPVFVTVADLPLSTRDSSAP
ncbi:MAG: alkaline phosphatase D family protein [Rhodococcus sp. (in: high G+C Gram-positive bacteria)]|uniref:alkaline phosphatase D family protein n=1 Tax=Rhodococcus sp. TaxID=1831 RepID=UPI003BAE9C08